MFPLKKYSVLISMLKNYRFSAWFDESDFVLWKSKNHASSVFRIADSSSSFPLLQATHNLPQYCSRLVLVTHFLPQYCIWLLNSQAITSIFVNIFSKAVYWWKQAVFEEFIQATFLIFHHESSAQKIIICERIKSVIWRAQHEGMNTKAAQPVVKKSTKSHTTMFV